jgi:uncharacterized protein YbjT (DUF2867 family)
MYTVAGASGRVGSATANRLLEDGHQVRVLVRDPAKGAYWAERGAEVRVVDLTDRGGLSRALSGSRGAFLLLPFDLTSIDIAGDTQRMVGAISGAVADSGIPHVVMLSSGGADLPEGTGPIVGLHQLEVALHRTGTVLTALRSGHFQEKVTDVLDAARHGGIYPVFASSADVPIPMVATEDLGAIAARHLQQPPVRSEVVDVLGPSYTERQVAEQLGRALARPLEVVTIPREGWHRTLVESGLGPEVGDVMVGLFDADERGLLAPRGDRCERGTAPLEDTLAQLLHAYA